MTTPQEIWSMRLQRELASLSSYTTTSAEANDSNSNNKSLEENQTTTKSATNAKDDPIGILPPFVHYKGHNLNIETGLCVISFVVDVEINHDNVSTTTSNTQGHEESITIQNNNDHKNNNNNNTQEEVITESTKTKPILIFTLDASLHNPITTRSDPTQTYPFSKPKATLTQGSQYFPPGSNIQNGHFLEIDCDWTPSLHLNDAALNIALKIRESIKRNEPYIIVDNNNNEDDGDFLSSISNEVSVGSARVGNFFSNLRNRASAVVQDLDQSMNDGYSGNTTTNTTTTTIGKNPNTTRLSRRNQASHPSTTPPMKKIVTIDNLEIGDEIDLSVEPWCHAFGMYSVKALKRPGFIIDAMAVAESNNSSSSSIQNRNRSKVSKSILSEEEEGDDFALAAFGNYMCTNKYLPTELDEFNIRKITGAGLSGAGSIFRSFTQSAKNLVEESFLMLTQDLILELKCNRFSVSNATVTVAIPVEDLSKLKFRREESLSLFFKQSPDDPFIYMCNESAEAVKKIQIILKQHGVKGKHTNAVMQRSVQVAQEMMVLIQSKEDGLEEYPSKESVTEIMDLYRQAAEKFEVAGDERHLEVMALMQSFLARPLVASILDGSYESKPTALSENAAVDVDTIPTDPEESTATVDEKCERKDSNDFQHAMKAAEDMLNLAHSDLEDLDINADDNDDDDDDNKLSTIKSDGDDNDVVSEFESMLADADKELAELMNS